MDLTILNEHLHHHLGQVDEARYMIGKIQLLTLVTGRLAVSAFGLNSELVGTVTLDEQASKEVREALDRWRERQEESLKSALSAMANKLDTIAADVTVSPLPKEEPLVNITEQPKHDELVSDSQEKVETQS